MRVMFDAYWWNHFPPSGRNVVRSTIAGWSRRYPDDPLTLATRPGDAPAVRAELAELGIEADLVSVPRLARFHALGAMSTGRLARAHDVVVTQNFGTRIRGGGVSAAFVHDAMYVEHPEWFTIPERAYLSILRPSLGWSDVVLTSSDAEASRIAAVWPEVADRLTAIGLGVPVPLLDAQPTRPHGMGDEPFVLAVGRINVRKNLGRLIEAFLSTPAASRHRLLVVGERDGRVADLGVPEADRARIEFTGRIDDGELKWLYRAADLFVFPSLDEGFGLPLAEARASGARVIASDIDVFREARLANGYFDPRSVESMRAAIATGLAGHGEDPDGEVQSWHDVVGRMRGAIEMAIDRRRAA